MLVGVKFCGGCNPRYDRKAYFEKIRQERPFWDFEFAEEGLQYDILLVIGGCPSCCASYEQYRFAKVIKVWEEGSI